MKTLMIIAVLLGFSIQDADQAKKEAEKLEKMVAKIVSNGKLLAEQEKLRAPKRMQKKMPAWLPPPLNIRNRDLSTGSFGFVDDTVIVDSVLGPKRFRAQVYLTRTDWVYIIVDNHPTKDYVDGQRVHVSSFVEVTGTEKNEFGETLRVLTQLDIPMDKIKAAVEAK